MRVAAFLVVILTLGVLLSAFTLRMENKYPPGESSRPRCALGQRAELPTKLTNEASALLRETLEKDRGGGIAAAVLMDGELVWSDAVGLADRRSGAPLTDASLMRLGSVSKPITAALAAKLHEKGLLDLDAPIQTYMPEFPDKGAPITIRLLASHLAGVRQYDFSNFEEANNRRQFESLNEGLALFASDPLAGEPGEKVIYSSFGYNLIGAAIENVTQKPFGEALKEHLLTPLHLQDIAIDDPSVETPCRARFYTVYFGRFPFNTIWRNHSEAYPSAGLLASAPDLAGFAHEVFQGRSFSDETRSLFTVPATLNDGEQTDRTFGWRVERNEQGEIVAYKHGGLTNGAYADLSYYPEDRMAIALIANYNLWLTDEQPQFYVLADEQLPDLFRSAAMVE